MKPILLTTLFLSTAWLLGKQTTAIAQLSPTSSNISVQSGQLSRDAATFPNFFQQGQESLDREIQLLYQRQNIPSGSSEAPIEFPLTIEGNPQTELDRLPQIRLRDFERIPSKSKIIDKASFVKKLKINQMLSHSSPTWHP